MMSQREIDFRTAEPAPWELVCPKCGKRHLETTDVTHCDCQQPIDEMEAKPKSSCENCLHNIPFTTEKAWCTLMNVRQKKDHICGNYRRGRHKNYDDWMKQ